MIMLKKNCLIKLAKRSICSSSNLIDFKNLDKCKPILESFHLFENFITEEEEKSLFEQVQNQLKRRRYEDSHFDYAIYQYREIEFKNWNEYNLNIINRIKELGFSDDPSKYNLSTNNLKPEISLNKQFLNQYSNQLSKQTINLSNNYSTNYDDEHIKQQSNSQQHNFNKQLNNLQNKLLENEISNNTSTTNSSTNDDKLNINLDKNLNKNVKKFSIIPEVHILDLHEKGAIKPHVDAVRFCGSRIIGLSLCSDAIMRLARVDDKDTFVDVFLKQRSLYIMRDYSRFNCTHEILGDDESIFKNQKIPRQRRISIIARCLPEEDVKE